MRNLITYEEISLLARPCTTDRETADAMVAEAQRVELKPRLGDALFIKLMPEHPEDRFDTLLEGGVWGTPPRENLLTGLKTALAYYALARIMRDGNIQATAYGAAVKDDQYSMNPETSERQRQYRELFEQADSYMAEVLNYLAENLNLFPEYAGACDSKMRSNRMTIRIIGK